MRWEICKSRFDQDIPLCARYSLRYSSRYPSLRAAATKLVLFNNQRHACKCKTDIHLHQPYPWYSFAIKQDIMWNQCVYAVRGHGDDEYLYTYTCIYTCQGGQSQGEVQGWPWRREEGGLPGGFFPFPMQVWTLLGFPCCQQWLHHVSSPSSLWITLWFNLKKIVLSFFFRARANCKSHICLKVDLCWPEY